MSEKQREAQQARRDRERAESSAGTQAAKAAEAMAARSPEAGEFQPDPNAATDAFNRPSDDAPREIKRGNPVRNAAYDQMMADRKERADVVHEEPREQAPQEPAQAAPEQLQQPEQIQQPPPEMVEVKIDGEVTQVPKSEIEEYGGINAYRMTKAAEKRLNEAKGYAASMGQQFQQIQALLQQKPSEPEKKPEEIIREAIAKIQLGSPEEAAAAFQQSISALMPKSVDPTAVAMQAFMLNQVTTAENAFMAANKDLIDNPLIKNMIIAEKERRLNAFRQQNSLPQDWNAFYTSIATDVRAAIGRPPIAASPVHTASQPSSGLAEKSARKADIVALPTAATRAAQEAQKPVTRDDLFANARKSRGQPV